MFIKSTSCQKAPAPLICGSWVFFWHFELQTLPKRTTTKRILKKEKQVHNSVCSELLIFFITQTEVLMKLLQCDAVHSRWVGGWWWWGGGGQGAAVWCLNILCVDWSIADPVMVHCRSNPFPARAVFTHSRQCSKNHMVKCCLIYSECINAKRVSPSLSLSHHLPSPSLRRRSKYPPHPVAHCFRNWRNSVHFNLFKKANSTVACFLFFLTRWLELKTQEAQPHPNYSYRQRRPMCASWIHCPRDVARHGFRTPKGPLKEDESLLIHKINAL